MHRSFGLKPILCNFVLVLSIDVSDFVQEGLDIRFEGNTVRSNNKKCFELKIFSGGQDY